MYTSLRMRRVGTPILIALAAVLAAGALLTSSGQAKSRAPGVRPTIVLVHGAWADSSSWDGEISRLQADGYPVVAPAVPLRSLSGDAAYIDSVLKTIKGSIVLVGHSYGGAVITNAAVGNPNVKALVYIDAFVPAEGESVLQLAAKNPGSELPASITEAPYTEGSGQSGVDIYIKPADFRSAFAGDVAPARGADGRHPTAGDIGGTLGEVGPPGMEGYPLVVSGGAAGRGGPGGHPEVHGQASPLAHRSDRCVTRVFGLSSSGRDQADPPCRAQRSKMKALRIHARGGPG